MNSKTTFNIKQTRISKAIKHTFKTSLMVCATGIVGMTTVSAAADKPWKTGYVLVKARAGLPAAKFKNILKGNRGQSVETIGSLKVHLVKVPEHAEEAVVRALSKNPHIEFAELDMAVEASEFIPNDPKYGNAWHLPKIQASSAWDYTAAEGITIAILDTGIDSSHPDLADKVTSGWNAVDGNSDTADINGHGTIVAGAAAAHGNNSTGIASVAWNAQIMPVRITNKADGYAYWSDVARGLNWAADNGADVANISYAVSGSSTVSSAAQNMRSKGGLVVVAAGNNGSELTLNDNLNMISVSATTSSDTKASWSNYGSFIDVAAPGVSILTTVRYGSYGSKSGTSLASPVTAGVVALIMGANPSLTPDEVERVLEDSADKIAGDWHPYFGNGRINAAAAVQMAMNMESMPIDEQSPTANIFSPVGGTTISGIALVEVTAGDNVGVKEVSLYANDQFIGTDGSAPYGFSWDSNKLADGDVLLTAYAIDAAGNGGASKNISVNVKNQPDVNDETPPSVKIGNPVDGSTVIRTVNIKVTAQDDVQVAQVKLYIDGKLRSTVNGDSLSFGWNTRKVSSGTHTIKALAIDTANKSSSQSIQVNIASTNTGEGKGRGKKK